MSKKATIIQKVLGVSKILLFVFYSAIFSQKKIEGNYYSDYILRDFSKSFNFKDDGKFNYKYIGDIGLIEYGRGYYKLKNDSLILSYNSTELKEGDFHKYRFYKNVKDSIDITINIYDLSSSNIISKHPVLIPSKNLHFNSDENGQVKIKLKKEKKQIQLNIPNINFGYDFKIWGDKNYEVDVFLNIKNLGMPIKNQILKYKIIKFKKEYIVLKSNTKTIRLTKCK